MDALASAATLDVPKALVQPARPSAWSPRRPRRPEEAWRQGCRQDADPGRDLRAAGRAPRAPGPGRRRAGACQQPASQAGAVAGAHRRDVAELRKAGWKCSALVPVATARAWPKSKPSSIENNVTDFVLSKAKVTDKEPAVRRADDGLIRHLAPERPALPGVCIWLPALPRRRRPEVQGRGGSGSAGPLAAGPSRQGARATVGL